MGFLPGTMDVSYGFDPKPTFARGLDRFSHRNLTANQRWGVVRLYAGWSSGLLAVSYHLVRVDLLK